MPRLNAAWLASRTTAKRRAFLDALSVNATSALRWLWPFWAHAGHQLAPEGDWRIWVILGGRGAGKTRAGAEWVRAQVEGARPTDAGRCRHVCLLGETIEQVRGVMVEGDSGLLACSPPDRVPDFRPSLNRLVWANGAEASLVSAANPEALRGPQFDCAWSDELAKWRRGREAWDMLQFGLRLADAEGADPRQIVTTTPRDSALLKEILADPQTVSTHAATAANRANLAPGFLRRLDRRYGGTALGRQEIEGLLVTEAEGALWSRAMIERARVAEAPALDRVVVAVDPPVTAHSGSDECGIVVAGLAKGRTPHAEEIYVLADRSAQGKSPHDWARRVAEAYAEFEADRVVAEVNQGGDLVEQMLRQVAPSVSYRGVRATRGKRLRAEPVAALYERGLVRHAGRFPALEDQMCRFTGGPRGADGIRSPDRLDALVWALTDLAIDPCEPREARIRGL